MSGRLVRAVPLFVVMVAMWLLLQGEASVGNVLGGAVLAAGLLACFPLAQPAVSHQIRPWAFCKFLVFVLYSLVMSSWAVIKIIVRPTPAALRSGILKVRLTVESPLTTTIVANAVTLTPGTMTLTARVDPAELHIHVLGLVDPEEFRESVYDLERRTLEAVRPIIHGSAGPATGEATP